VDLIERYSSGKPAGIGFLRADSLKHIFPDTPGNEIDWYEAVEILRMAHRKTAKLKQRPLAASIWHFFCPRRFFNIRLEAPPAGYRKKALLSYVALYFDLDERSPQVWWHVNTWHAREIIKALNRLGYSVDLVDYRDMTFKPREKYDLFIGHGAYNFTSLSQSLPADTPKIYLATTSYWKFNNYQEIARVLSIRKRSGKLLPFDRYINKAEEMSLRKADSIILFGNDRTARTYMDFPGVFTVNTTVRTGFLAPPVPKTLSGMKNFLFYSGKGNTHKGLDLLLEAFSKEENSNLWICTALDAPFSRMYSSLLFRKKNIHYAGWLSSRSEDFQNIIAGCNWVILPSASEGMATSVLECMERGLVPVITRACGVSLENSGVLIGSLSPEKMAALIRECSAMPFEKYLSLSSNAREQVLRDMSEASFRKNIHGLLSSLIQASSGAGKQNADK
jgi:glycosyltransferase involved in cell wall biosynthesis